MISPSTHDWIQRSPTAVSIITLSTNLDLIFPAASLHVALRERWHFPNTTQDHTVLSLLIDFTTSASAPPAAALLRELDIIFGDYFKPIPAPEGRSFEEILCRIDDLISGLPKDPDACKVVLRSGDHYRSWLPKLRQNLPRTMPSLSQQGLVMVDDKQ